jgi:hypothetical protein
MMPEMPCWHSLEPLLELVYPSSNTKGRQPIGHNVYKDYPQAHGFIVVTFHPEVVTEPPNYTRLSKKIVQRQDNLTNLSPYNPVVREISTDFKPFT